MKNKLLILASSAFLATFVTGALAAEIKKPVKKPEAKTEKSVLTDPNKVVLVSKKSRTFSINLRSNPTTGYSWVLVDNYDQELIKPVSHKFHAPDSKLIGAPGYETFTFKIDNDGFRVPQKTQITFQYVRPWVVMGNSQKMKFTIITRESALPQPKTDKK